jgi:hypothetical protein
MIEVIVAAIKRHVVHLKRFVDAGGVGVGERQQLRGRLNIDVEVATGEAAREVVVIAAQVIAPEEFLAGGAGGPQVICPHQDSYGDEDGAACDLHLFRLTDPSRISLRTIFRDQHDPRTAGRYVDHDMVWIDLIGATKAHSGTRGGAITICFTMGYQIRSDGPWYDTVGHQFVERGTSAQVPMFSGNQLPAR